MKVEKKGKAHPAIRVCIVSSGQAPRRLSVSYVHALSRSVQQERGPVGEVEEHGARSRFWNERETVCE